MSDKYLKWGLTYVAIFVAIIGLVGNLILGPNLVVILGLLTGTVLMFMLNIFHIKYVQKNIDDDTYSGDDLFDK